ncbi:hypothetical protein EC968_002913 [Mortierella alpina]|nr:hypothetical protein EC968_002913 [Mortierella alpina]
MVLEQPSNVKWFTPAKAKASRGSSRAPSPRRPQRWGQQDQAQAPVAPTVTSKAVTQESPAPAPASAPHSTSAVDPWSVYGPTFERMACRGGRSSSSRLGKEVLRNVLPSHRTPQVPDSSSKGRRRIRSQQRHRFVYPSDSALSSSSAQSDIAGLLTAGLDATSEPEDESGSEHSYDDEHLTLENAFAARSLFAQDQDIYFTDMPLELLNDIFLSFMCISNDSLHRLAQERSDARTKATQQTSATAASAVSSAVSSGALPNARSGIEPTRESNRQLTNSTHHCRQLLRDSHVSRSQHQHHLHQRLRHVHRHHRHRHHYHEHSSEQGLFQELQSASQASSSTTSSSSSFSSHLGASSLFPETASTLFLVTDQDPSYDGEEEEEDNENDTESDTSDARSLDELSAAASVETIPDFAGDGFDSDEVTSSEDGGMSPQEESGDSGSHDIDYAYRDETVTQSAASSSQLTAITSSSSTSEDDENQVDRAYELDSAAGTENLASGRSTGANATVSSSSVYYGKSGKRYYRHRHAGARQCCCRRTSTNAAGFVPKPRLGINRVDNDLEEDKMLYQLHRDQYFHPTTHTSLRSELYTCSLVNRQWRMAALQLLWQSVVLDSESCRPEPSDPCTCCNYPRSSLKGLSNHQLDAEMSLPSPPLSTSSSSSSSSPFPMRIVRTRLEAMLDSYQDLYGLDLAKCVQTVELDLRLLVWSAEGESVKRILRRLSPFTHLRLVWAGKESPEEMMTGFQVAMESLHSQIRHLHFFSGFVISPAWTREMAKMTRLHTVTIESLGSLDAIEYDWTRLKCLKLHSVIPRSVFRWPSSAPTASQTQHTLSEGTVNGYHQQTTMLHHAGALLTAGMNTPIGLGTVTGANAEANTTNQGNAWVSTQHAGTNGWSGSQQQLLPPLLPGSGGAGLLPSAAATAQLHGSATAMHHPSNHPERMRGIGSGWWQWTGLRRLDLQLKNTVLPKEWLQDLTAAIAQNSATLTKQEQYLHQQRLVTGKQVLLPFSHQPFSVLDYEQEGLSSYGPPLEVLNIDCEVSHQHKDIFMDLVRVWGHRMEEFHFSHSGELTDEFLWLCLVRMTRLKRLSLRDSRGITGEGVSRRQRVDVLDNESLLNASRVVDALATQGPTSSGHVNSNVALDPEPSEKTQPRKTTKVPIKWRRDFKELNLDQSRVRQEFLQILKQRCPGVVYKVREVRQRTS